MNRRALLCLAVPAASWVVRPARAFREEPADDATGRAWADRCGGASLAAGPVTVCPFCGCPVVGGGRDHGERGPLPAGY